MASRVALKMEPLAAHRVPDDGNCQFSSIADKVLGDVYANTKLLALSMHWNGSPRESDVYVACNLTHSKFHHRVREAVVHQMNRHRSAYQPFVPVDYDRFLAAMSDTSGMASVLLLASIAREALWLIEVRCVSAVWGNHITIQAAADALGVRILLVTSNKTGPPILEILPSGHEYSRTIWLCYYCELHYNALYTKEGTRRTLTP